MLAMILAGSLFAQDNVVSSPEWKVSPNFGECSAFANIDDPGFGKLQFHIVQSLFHSGIQTIEIAFIDRRFDENAGPVHLTVGEAPRRKPGYGFAAAKESHQLFKTFPDEPDEPEPMLPFTLEIEDEPTLVVRAPWFERLEAEIAACNRKLWKDSGLPGERPVGTNYKVPIEAYADALPDRVPRRFRRNGARIDVVYRVNVEGRIDFCRIFERRRDEELEEWLCDRMRARYRSRPPEGPDGAAPYVVTNSLSL